MRMHHRICDSDSVNLCLFMQSYLLYFILPDKNGTQIIPNLHWASVLIHICLYAPILKTNILKRKGMKFDHTLFLRKNLYCSNIMKIAKKIMEWSKMSQQHFTGRWQEWYLLTPQFSFYIKVKMEQTP